MSCGHDIDHNCLFCYYCGAKQARKICVCLKVNPIEARFCSQCGHDIDNLIKEKNLNLMQNGSMSYGSKYNLAELMSEARNSENRSLIKNEKLSQEEIDSYFHGIKRDENKQ